MADYPGWQDAASPCAYPFVDDAPRTTAAGTTLPTGWILDARLNVPDGALAVGLVAVTATGGGVTLSFALDGAPFASATAQTGARTVELTGGDGATAGLLVLDPDAAPAFDLAFAADGLVLCESCLFRYPVDVLRHLTVLGPGLDDTRAIPRGGRLAFAEGAGVRLVGVDASTLRFDAVGAPVDVAACVEALGPPVRTLGGIAPDARGDYRFDPESYAEPTGGDAPRQVLQVQAQTNGLLFYLARGTDPLG